jgi:2,3-bisphosphoglycerate-independent phosphoglycerate mutase
MMKMIKDHGGSRLAEAVKSSYAHGSTDYYMEPLVRVDENGIPIGKIKSGDTVIFACRRGEREIELTEMFTDPDFDKADRTSLSDLNFVILTMYHEKFKDLPIAFAPLQVQRPLAEIISEAGLRQLHCAESEKFAHITYFLNGGCSLPYPGEDDVCIPSATGDPAKRPQLNLPKVVDAVTERLGKYDFIAVNFANGDIVGHTSDRGAKIEAAFHISSRLERLVEAAKKHDYGLYCSLVSIPVPIVHTVCPLSCIYIGVPI